MNRVITIAIVVAGMGVAIFYTFHGNTPKNEPGYRESIMTERAEKDTYFKTEKDSPLTDEQKEVFTHLSYFPVDEKYRIKAKFVKNNREQIITMATSDEKERGFFVYGKVHFQLDGNALELTVYKPVDDNDEYYFMPFFDATSAVSTYGSGRYLDPEIDGNTALLDFNKAYNPYCAYNHNYSCPIPPLSNKLSVPIEAGEKIPEL